MQLDFILFKFNILYMCAKYLMLHLNKAFFAFARWFRTGVLAWSSWAAACAPADRPERGRRHGGRLIDQLIWEFALSASPRPLAEQQVESARWPPARAVVSAIACVALRPPQPLVWWVVWVWHGVALYRVFACHRESATEDAWDSCSFG